MERRRREPLPSETVAGAFLEYATKVINDAEGDPKLERLRPLVEDVRQKMFAYIESRKEFADAARTFRVAPDKEAMMAADQHRRRAHIALTDAFRILARNVAERSEEPTPRAFVGLIGDSEDAAVRDRVAAAAIDYTLSCLEHEA